MFDVKNIQNFYKMGTTDFKLQEYTKACKLDILSEKFILIVTFVHKYNASQNSSNLLYT